MAGIEHFFASHQLFFFVKKLFQEEEQQLCFEERDSLFPYLFIHFHHTLKIIITYMYIHNQFKLSF